MNILLVGGGGREHALAWKIAASPLTRRLICAPGNPGIASVCETRALAATDIEAIAALARDMAADLVVIGPESAIAAGLADRLAKLAIPAFGPSAAAGRLETSKAWARAFAARHGVPGARFGVFCEAAAARRFLDEMEAPFVIKADGLAAGKGVVIAADRAEAQTAIEALLGGRFGAAGTRVVIESFLDGEIASVFALCDGETSLLFGGAQDHKRAFDGERGPNTGGMGAYAPAPPLSAQMMGQVRCELIDPAFAGVAAEGAPYRGALFCELMITAQGPRLIEYNARFGDPECQVLMLRLKSDLVPYLAAAATGTLAGMAAPVWREEAAICVVLAAQGYPDAPRTGGEIAGAEGDLGAGVRVFHAGTARRADGALIAAGGRVLNVCALGADLQQARRRAYRAIDRIEFAQGFCRRDIGWRALGHSARSRSARRPASLAKAQA